MEDVCLEGTSEIKIQTESGRKTGWERPMENGSETETRSEFNGRKSGSHEKELLLTNTTFHENKNSQIQKLTINHKNRKTLN